jgi:hypothetical protein
MQCIDVHCDTHGFIDDAEANEYIIPSRLRLLAARALALLAAAGALSARAISVAAVVLQKDEDKKIGWRDGLIGVPGW